MFSFNRISLSVLIPAIAMILLLISQGMLVSLEFKQQQKSLLHSTEDRLLQNAYQLQQSLSDTLSQLRWDLAERQIALVSLAQNLDGLQIINPEGLVLLSADRAEKHLFAVDLHPHFELAKLHQAKGKKSPIVLGDLEQWRVNIYLPLDMGPREDSLSRAETGGIFLSYNLRSDWQLLQAQIIEQAIKQFMVMAVAMAMLILMLNRLLVRPLNKLVKNTAEIERDAPVALETASQGEIGELQRAIKGMASNIHDNIQRLQDSEQRWQFALNGSGDGIWDWDLTRNRVYYSKQWQAMLGYEELELGEGIEEWESRIHPGDKDKTLNQLRQHLKKTSNVFECMHRIRHKNGNYLWVLSRGMVVERTEQGLPARVISTQTNMSEIRSAQEMLRFQSSHDDITRLANRRKLLENLDSEIEKSRDNQQCGALIYIDIDHFKNVNDTLGHAAGDLLLRLIAHRLREGRAKNQTVARLGGDEFAILLPELASSRDQATNVACEMAEAVGKSIHREFEIKGNQISLNLTIGVAVYPNRDSNAIELLRQAEIALYHGKDSGRSNIHIFSDEMADRIQERHKLLGMMRTALEQEDMVAYYQPRYNSLYEMVGAETLIRWFDADLGWISPGRFIPLAEESGLIINIGEYVMRSACNTLRKWQDKGLPQNFKTLSVNVSPKQFHRDSFVSETIDIIRESGCDPTLLELEITEGVLVDNLDDTVNKIQRLRDLGVRFSVDDFGTGYSSLAYLNKLPINCLKIDKSFVSELQTGGSECAIITTIISMAENLDLEVIAEGVETEYQLEFLKYRRCNVYQGFFFSEALEEQIFEARLFGKRDVETA